MSDKNMQVTSVVVPAEKPDSTSDRIEEQENDILLKRSFLAKAMVLEQQAADPIEKGPFLSNNSPRNGRSASVIQAKLREQESRHSLEILRIKHEYETRESEMSKELALLAELRQSLAETQEKLEKEIILRKDAERRDEQTTKDLLIISLKCGELQGRLDESHAALTESRNFIETLQALHDERLATMKKEFAEAEKKGLDQNENLEMKVSELEHQVKETRTGFQKAMTEKMEGWKRSEAELIGGLKQEESRCEKLIGEKNELLNKVELLETEVKAANGSRDMLQTELKELREYHRLELDQLDQERNDSQRDWNEKMEAISKELAGVVEEFQNAKKSSDELLEEKESNLKKQEESIKVLKDALTVLDEQNKELTSELKLIQEKCEEKESVRLVRGNQVCYRFRFNYSTPYALVFNLYFCSATLASQVNSLVTVKNEYEEKLTKLLADKSKLEEELTLKAQENAELVLKKDMEVRSIQEDLASTKESMTKELVAKERIISTLESNIETLKETMAHRLDEKADKIDELAKELEKERKATGIRAEESNRLNESVQNLTVQLDEANVKYECSQQQIGKMKADMSRLINEV